MNVNAKYLISNVFAMYAHGTTSNQWEKKIIEKNKWK